MRLARHAVTIFGVISLLLCVAAAAMWVRTRVVADAVTWASGGRLVSVQSSGERLVLAVVRDFSDRRPLRWTRGWPADAATFPRAVWPGRNMRHGSFLGIHVFHGQACWVEATDNRYNLKALPLYPIKVFSVGWDSVALWAAIVPAAVAIVRLRRRRARQRRGASGLCAECGYDLRASPGRCPECGSAAAADGPRASL